jgi:hypothetical protein
VQEQVELKVKSQPLDLLPLQEIVASIKNFQAHADTQDEEDQEPPKKRARHSFEDFLVNIPEDESAEESEEGAVRELEEPREEELPVMPEEMGKWSKVLLSSARQAKITLAQHRVLRSLRFSDIRIRESSIRDAHPNTYNWIVETDRDRENERQGEIPSINTWLQSGDGVFWLAGKAGSGKSTLMKHVTRQANLTTLLQPWARRRKIVICRFFFWNSGSKLQKSQEGLLRTIFYQILHSCPELILELVPERCGLGADNDNKTDWNLMDLLQLLKRFVAMEFTKECFCIFIDGLDECGEDLLDLIAVLESMKNSRIKMCLSSRPWNCFEEAFGQDKQRLIRLEEHNRADISRFVNDTISSAPGFRKLQRLDPECNSLINEIVDKAQGVFLWVFLVTRSLIRGLTNGDSIHTLRVRLQKFPPELEPYFMHMFKSIESVYLQESAELLQISLAAIEPLPIMLYQALLEPDIDTFAEQCRELISTSDLDTFLLKIDQTKTRINARCQDLLETIDCPSSRTDLNNSFLEAYQCSKVDFLHRTVSDFLRQPEMTALLAKHARENFEPRAEIGKAFQVIFHSFDNFN